MDSSDFLRQILFQPYLVKKKTPYVRRTSPGTRMFLLTIYLPWLLNMLPYSYWALTCLAVLPTYSAFMVSVRQASDLPPASFRFPVTQDTLALGYILPAVGRIRDFHPLKHAPAGRTKKRTPQKTLRGSIWRRRRDLNPRYPFGVYTISNRARSASYATSPCACSLRAVP